jgi:hypothetical protein
MRKSILVLVTVVGMAAPAGAERNTGGGPKGLNYTCGAWGPNPTKPGFQCRRCERCKTTAEGAIDCQTIEVKNQCTDGPTDGVDPPAPLTGGVRPPKRVPNASTIRPPASQN